MLFEVHAVCVFMFLGVNMSGSMTAGCVGVSWVVSWRICGDVYALVFTNKCACFLKCVDIVCRLRVGCLVLLDILKMMHVLFGYGVC